MPRSLIRVKPIRKILTATEPDVMVQILRLIVLYEDLKLELNLIRLPQNKVARRSERTLPNHLHPAPVLCNAP